MAQGTCIRCGSGWGEGGMQMANVVCNRCTYQDLTGRSADLNPEDFRRWLTGHRAETCSIAPMRACESTAQVRRAQLLAVEEAKAELPLALDRA